MSEKDRIITPAMPEAQALMSGSSREGQIQLLFANQRKMLKQLSTYTTAVNEAIKMAHAVAAKQDAIDAALEQVAKRLTALEKKPSGKSN